MGARVFHDSISMFVGEGDNSLLPRWALGCDLDLLAGGLLSAVLWISMILLSGRAGNTSFILRILTADAVTCTYDLVGFILLVSLAFRPDWRFLDFSSCSLVRRRGMGGGTLLIGLLLGFLEQFSRGQLALFPNCNVMLSQTEVLPEVYSLSHPDSKMAEMNVHVASQKGASWGMLPSQSLRLRCLRKDAICCREHAMLRTLL